MRLSAVIFIKKSWSKSFNIGIAYNGVGFKCIWATLSRQYTEHFYKLFYQSNWNWMVKGRLQFQKYPTHQCTKMLRRENLCFLTRNFQSHQNSITLNLIFTLPLRILLKPWTFSCKKDTITAKTVSKLKCLEEPKKLRFQMKDRVLHSLVRILNTFLDNVGNEVEVMLRRKRPQKPEPAYDIVRIHSLMIYTDLIDYNIVGDTKAPLLRCFLFISKLKSGDTITTGQSMNYQTFSNLQFRPLLKNSFHSIHIDFRDTSGEKIPSVSAGITRFVLMFRKASTIHF